MMGPSWEAGRFCSAAELRRLCLRNRRRRLGNEAANQQLVCSLDASASRRRTNLELPAWVWTGQQELRLHRSSFLLQPLSAGVSFSHQRLRNQTGNAEVLIWRSSQLR